MRTCQPANPKSPSTLDATAAPAALTPRQLQVTALRPDLTHPNVIWLRPPGGTRLAFGRDVTFGESTTLPPPTQSAADLSDASTCLRAGLHSNATPAQCNASLTQKTHKNGPRLQQHTHLSSVSAACCPFGAP